MPLRPPKLLFTGRCLVLRRHVAHEAFLEVSKSGHRIGLEPTRGLVLMGTTRLLLRLLLFLLLLLLLLLLVRSLGPPAPPARAASLVRVGEVIRQPLAGLVASRAHWK